MAQRATGGKFPLRHLSVKQVEREVAVETVEQEGEERRPTGKTQIARQRPQIIKEGRAAHSRAAQRAVLSGKQVEQGGKEQRQEIAGGQERGKMLRPMSAVVFPMIARSCEGSGGCILDFPARTVRLHEGRDSCGSERDLSYEGMGIEPGPCGMCERQFTPIDGERSRARS
jgi:hypothetical protein